MNEFRQKLKSEFKDKEYAHAYSDAFLNSYIATQIKVLREQRGWSQQRLAQEAKMKQERISVLEDPDYGSWSLSTLRRLATAFDVTLTVSFETFGRKIQEIEAFSRANLQRQSREEEFSESSRVLHENWPSSILSAINSFEKMANKSGVSAIDSPSAIQNKRYESLYVGAQEQLNKPKSFALAEIGS